MHYWKGLWRHVDSHVKQCLKCRQQNMHSQHYVQSHLEVPLSSMHFITMDLIGRFKPLPPRTLICSYCNRHVDKLWLVHTNVYKRMKNWYNCTQLIFILSLEDCTKSYQTMELSSRKIVCAHCLHFRNKASV